MEPIETAESLRIAATELLRRSVALDRANAAATAAADPLRDLTRALFAKPEGE